ncbi:MAG: glycosyltransferase family A protein [Bacteroidales bacterium]|jgi:glycosyltransferase involved in cell wall biosynthesis|nr:glycosyltransferase family A protein [Bacteroidales bacterium]
MIRIISITALVFAGLRLLVALVNYLFRPGKKPGVDVEELPVSVLIPARNEENNIGKLLDQLGSQDYHNLEIIVLDDSSDDNTAAVVREKMAADSRIKLIENDHVPGGWSGKNHACHLLSREAGGKYFLFLDADISIRGNIIPAMLHYLERHGLVLLSIFPKQIMRSFGERITVPNMNWILLSLLPLLMVRLSKRPSLSAANGQFMLFDAAAYRSLRPHEMVRSSLVEDIEMMRKLKKMRPDSGRRRSLRNRYKTAVLTGDDRISCRMYADFDQAVHGFSKNVLHFFGNSLLWTFIFLFLTGPVIFIIPFYSLPFALIYLLAGILTRVLISLTSRQNIVHNTVLAPLQQLSLWFIVYKAVKIKFAGSYTWKGRQVKT